MPVTCYHLRAASRARGASQLGPVTDHTQRTRAPGPGPGPGLCGACHHSRRIRTRGGSEFRLCERSVNDPRFARYPALPVLLCAGFEPVSGSVGEGGEAKA